MHSKRYLSDILRKIIGQRVLRFGWGRWDMLVRAALALGLLIAAGQSAWAVCDFCNPTIRLNQRVADCFGEQLPAEMQRLQLEGRGFVLVDLTQCVDAKTRGLPRAGATTAPDDVDTSFVADEVALRCIGAEIERRSGALDPSIELDLTRCQ
jgi:hypothetical protein